MRGKSRKFQKLPDVLLNLDAELCRKLLNDILLGLTLLDPACGSGTFLVAAMKTLINIYLAVIGRIKFLNDPALTAQVKHWEAEHKSLAYFIKRTIVTDNLFGVDLMEEATEIAKLRLFLALVASAETVDQLEPLPNIDFNILSARATGKSWTRRTGISRRTATRCPGPAAWTCPRLKPISRNTRPKPKPF